MPAALLLLTLAAPGQAPAPASTTPYAAVRAALADAQAQKAAGANTHCLRYGWVQDGLAAEADAYRLTGEYVVNSLDLHNLRPVPGVPLAGGRLVRYDLKALRIDPECWDRFVQAGSGPVPVGDPYFSVLVDKVETYYEREYWGGGYEAGAYYAAGWYRREKTRKTRSLQPGPWVTTPDGGRAVLALVELTGSKTPCVRLDWMNTYALWAPGYYTLLGVDPAGSVDQIDKLLGVNQPDALRTRIQWLTDSKRVTIHQRVVDRWTVANTPEGGYLYVSNDTDKGIDDEDYLVTFAQSFLLKRRGRRFDSGLKFQATEEIFSTPKKLHAYAVTDAKGKLLNAAVSTIANDTTSLYAKRLSDTNVYVGRNCVVCHDRAGGLQLMADRVRKLSRNRLALAVKQRGGSADVAADIANAYASDPDAIVKLDMAKYAAGVRGVNGRTVEENARIYEQQTARYLADGVTLDVAAGEAGVTPARLRAILSAASGLDPRLAGLLQEPPETIDRLQYERASYAQMMTLVAGFKE
jgi:hypothetical protein